MFGLREPAVSRAAARLPAGIVMVSTVLVLWSCRDSVSPAGTDDAAPAVSKASGPVFSVSPSGGNDTDAIRAAIAQAQAAGPGSTVYLEPGEFRTGILIFEDFVGTFRGAGADRTIVRSSPNLDFGSGPFYVEYPTYDSPWPSLVTAVGGDITLSDMSFVIDDESPALPYDFFGLTTDALGYIVTVTGDAADSRIDRVSFEGSAGGLMGFNTFSAIYVFGAYASDNPLAVSGDHVVSKSSFRGLLLGLGAVVGDAHWTIGGSPPAANTINDVLYGIVINEGDHSTFEVSHNLVDAEWLGIRVWHGYMHQAHQADYPEFPLAYDSRVRIAHNTIIADYFWADGLMLRDAAWLETGEPELDLVIEQNEIVLDTDFGGISGLGAQGVLIRSNRIIGSALAGIYLGLSSSAANADWLLLGNNVHQVDALYAPILLGPNSNHVTVVGGPNETSVLDLGTDNTLTGVNNMQGNPPGPDIWEAMRARADILKAIRG